MKFLLNMNVAPQLGKKLIGVEHSCRHVKDIGMARAEDTEIIKIAKAHQEVIIPHNLD